MNILDSMKFCVGLPFCEIVDLLYFEHVLPLKFFCLSVHPFFLIKGIMLTFLVFQVVRETKGDNCCLVSTYRGHRSAAATVCVEPWRECLL